MILSRHPHAHSDAVLGLVHALIGLAGLAAGVFVLVFHPRLIEAVFGIPAIHAWPVFLLVSIGLLAPSLIGGVSLIRGQPSGRALIMVVSLLLLPLIPLGTALGLWGLIRLGRRRPSAWPATGDFQKRREAYEADPEATWTCDHLAPIEQASRRAGVRLTPVGDRDVLILAPVFRPSLERLIAPGSPVRCLSVPAPERSLRDPPRSMLHCAECRSSLRFEDAGASVQER